MRNFILRFFFGTEPMISHFNAMLEAKAEAKWQRAKERDFAEKQLEALKAKNVAIVNYTTARESLEAAYNLVLD